MEGITQLRESLKESNKRAIPTQVFWGTIKEVDWENKNCTVTGLSDGLDFFNVSLGLNGVLVKPKTGTKCMVGIIQNQEVDTYLIEVEEFEEFIYQANDCLFKVKENGFVVQFGDENIRTLLLDWIEAIKKMKFTTNTGSTIELINKPEFIALEPRVKKLFKEN